MKVLHKGVCHRIYCFYHSKALAFVEKGKKKKKTKKAKKKA